MKSLSHYILSPLGHSLHIKEFRGDKAGHPILFIHGAIESGSIFYSKNNKGLAPYLCQQGFHCFVIDLRARGQSTPPLKEAKDFNQYDLLDHDLPLVLSFIFNKSSSKKFSFISHSWGGVLANSFLLKSPHWLENCIGNVHVSTKRRVGIINLHRFFYIDLMWLFFGSLISAIKGHLPPNYYGPEGESKGTLKDSQKWVYAKTWTDSANNLDYNDLANQYQLPRTLYLTGKRDHCLGHIKDVQRFALESKSDLKDFYLLSKENGNLKDYDHIDILTSSTGPKDHFPQIADFLRECLR
jgi:predicted alpha/beta hydrolase